jgi:hypothetical protein
MAKFKLGKLKQTRRGWQETIVERIHNGKVLPIISHETVNDLLFGHHGDLIEGWCEYSEYPFAGQSLTHMLQFTSVMSKADEEIKADNVYIKETYLNFLKMVLFSLADDELVEELEEDANLEAMSVSNLADRLEFPQFSPERPDPFQQLADLPLPIYITTSPHTVFEDVLRQAGKDPQVEICYWNDYLTAVPSVFNEDRSYEPTPEKPLVYHLFGLDQYPNSLVLTEDDHLDFLVRISQDKYAVPVRIRHALADSSLLMMGYRLESWAFRVIFRGMIKTGNDQRRPKSIALQLQDDDQQKTYYKNYLEQEAQFEVYWGGLHDFVNELWQGWAGT